MAEQSISSLQQQEEEKTVTSPGQKDTTKEWDRQDETPRESAEVAGEVFKVLQIKRWQVQDGPFRGFDSPPGRF